MSAIDVVWIRQGGNDAAGLHAKMAEAQRRYGRDRGFRWSDDRIALGGHLLELLPEDVFDRQPLWGPDRSFCLVADVRLDNRVELVQKLGLSADDRLADSEILLAAWARWEQQCLHHIVGAFAFAVWNPARQELFAARDHLGDRPLYFYCDDEMVAVATMPKGILALPGVPRGIDEIRMVDALALANPAPARSFQAAIHKLPQASLLRVTPDKCETRAYWSPLDARPIRFSKDSDYVEAFLEIFDRAVAVRLRTNKRVASQLSAGMDSSSVTATVALALAAEGKRLSAFTAVPRRGFLGKGFHGRIPDEGPGASEVAARYPNIDHHLVDSEGVELIPTLCEMVDALDEPAQNGINLLWSTAIMRRSSELGANALLVGYRGNGTLSYNGYEALAMKLRRGRLLDLAGTTYRMRKGGHISWRAAFAQATVGMFPDRIYRALMRSGNYKLNYSPGSPAILEQYGVYARMLKEFYDNSGDLLQERRIFFERFDYGVYNAAVRAIHGIDVRDPTADKRLFDFCYAIPMEQYIVGDQPRSLVRRAMKNRLPASTLARTIRGQQGADWYLSMQDARPSLAPLAAVIERSPTARRMLDLPRMRGLLDTWPEGGLEAFDTSQSYGDALCRFMSFGYFLAKEDDAAAHTTGTFSA